MYGKIGSKTKVYKHHVYLNKAFQHHPVKKMKLVKTGKCGSGIVADEDIKLGEFVIEYVGEVN